MVSIIEAKHELDKRVAEYKETCITDIKEVALKKLQGVRI